jgi:hypothetical protein
LVAQGGHFLIPALLLLLAWCQLRRALGRQVDRQKREDARDLRLDELKSSALVLPVSATDDHLSTVEKEALGPWADDGRGGACVRAWIIVGGALHPHDHHCDDVFVG